MSLKNIFVPALTDFQRRELETVRSADGYAFHSLLDTESLIEEDEYDFAELLERARRQLREFPDSVDAIVAHWDFPTSVLAPILAHEHGVPSPSLRSVLACEHKYWSRLEQAVSVPEVVPQFAAFDPFDDDPLASIDLEFPFWVKPVKSFSSQLGFRIDGPDDFAEALEELREGVGRLGHAFDEVLDMVDLPPEIQEAPGTTCLAEQIISGIQAAPEGTMFQGEFNVHGCFDMLKGEGGSFDRLDYPSALSQELQDRMTDVCERLLRQIGFDNGCFNVEFMWDRDTDKLWLIEVNTRISQSHSDLFAKVDGASNHEVAIDIALGQRPIMPRGDGPYEVASQCHIPHRGDDAIIKAVPSQEDIARLDERFPGTVVELGVEPGDRLSELPNQAEARYELGMIYLGADSREELDERYHACLEALQFEFAPVEES